MKTPIQEIIEVMQEKLKVDTLQYNARPSNGSLIAIKISQFYLEMAQSMLKKEKYSIIDAYKEGCFDYILDESTDQQRAEEYYNETFKDIPLK